MNKRQNLSKSFLSHFQIIKFPCFNIDELKEIAENLFKSFNNGQESNDEDKQFISDLITFHKEWTSREENKNEIEYFTIREIAATVKAYIVHQKKKPFRIVKAIYSSRYSNNKKNEILKLIGQFDSFKNEYLEYLNYGTNFQIPNQMKEYYYENKSLKEVFESSLFSLKMKRNIIIVGKPGSGKSYISRGIAEIYNSKRSYYHFICTQDTKISDLIGYISPIKEVGINNIGISMEWIEGFLSKSIENGNVAILDNLHEANSTITERLNGLLDINYDETKKKATIKQFDIPENPLKNAIKIHDDFRIIGICNSESINKMTPAFLNRFDIIVLENQLKNIKKDELENLIKILLNKHISQYKIKSHNIFENLRRLSMTKILSTKTPKLNIEELLNNNINYIINKLEKFIDYNNQDYNENSIEKFTIFDISRFCFSLIAIMKKEELRKVPISSLIDFIYDLLFSEKEIEISNYGIKEILLNILNEKIKKAKNNKEQFIFEDNQTLENYILIIFSCFIINLHLCISGPPGAGKTSSAKFISEILQEDNIYKLFNLLNQMISMVH